MSVIGPRPGLWNQDILTAERDKYGAILVGLTQEQIQKVPKNIIGIERTDGLIQERNINTGEKVEFEVSGDKIEAIHMIPGWTHNIINLSETENLVTVMTCNEIFDSNHPDTFGEPV